VPFHRRTSLASNRQHPKGFQNFSVTIYAEGCIELGTYYEPAAWSVDAGATSLLQLNDGPSDLPRRWGRYLMQRLFRIESLYPLEGRIVPEITVPASADIGD
jgi:hypothetical protein